MQELVKFMVSELVENKDTVEVVLDNETVKITVAKDEVSKIIGRQGRTLKAIRTIVAAASDKSGKKYSVEVVES